MCASACGLGASRRTPLQSAEAPAPRCCLISLASAGRRCLATPQASQLLAELNGSSAAGNPFAGRMAELHLAARARWEVETEVSIAAGAESPQHTDLPYVISRPSVLLAEIVAELGPAAAAAAALTAATAVDASLPGIADPQPVRRLGVEGAWQLGSAPPPHTPRTCRRGVC